MSKKQIEEAAGVWGVLHIPTGKFVKFGVKCGWSGASGAKRAFQVHMGVKFADCPDFKAVCLSEAYYRLEGLEK